MIDKREQTTKITGDREKIKSSQIRPPEILFQLNNPKTTSNFLGHRVFGITRKQSDVTHGLPKQIIQRLNTTRLQVFFLAEFFGL